MTRATSDLPVDTLVQRFQKYQERQQAAIRDRDIPAANRHYDKVKQYADALATTPRGRDALEELARSPLAFVRHRAAWRVLKWAPEIAVPVLGRHLIGDFGTDLSIDERLELSYSAKLSLYHFFGITSYDHNDLIEPLKAYGIEVPYWDHSKWQ